MNTLTTYLNEYYKIQPEITLVYRPTPNHGWGRACKYLGTTYNPAINYNHRCILRNEIVIEYDEGDPNENRKYVDEIAKRLSRDGLTWAKWFSGGKSVHLHILADMAKASHTHLLKKAFIRIYTEGLPIPDLQLCGDNHLIRAEYGVHEKTQVCKSLISKNGNYFQVNTLPEKVWEKYRRDMMRVMNMQVTKDLKEFERLPGINLLLHTEEFKKAGDGRERAMLLLIRVLKEKYQKDELKQFMSSWYHYAGGKKLRTDQIHRKVEYYWSKDYSLRWYQEYLEELLEDIGRKDLIKHEEKQEVLT